MDVCCTSDVERKAPPSHTRLRVCNIHHVHAFCVPVLPISIFQEGVLASGCYKSLCPFISESQIALEKRQRSFPGKWENIFISETRSLKMPQRVSSGRGWGIAAGSLAETVRQHHSVQGRSRGPEPCSHHSPPHCLAQCPPLLPPVFFCITLALYLSKFV